MLLLFVLILFPVPGLVISSPLTHRDDAIPHGENRVKPLARSLAAWQAISIFRKYGDSLVFLRSRDIGHLFALSHAKDFKARRTYHRDDPEIRESPGGPDDVDKTLPAISSWKKRPPGQRKNPGTDSNIPGRAEHPCSIG